jgi:hypothetical protein
MHGCEVGGGRRGCHVRRPDRFAGAAPRPVRGTVIFNLAPHFCTYPLIWIMIIDRDLNICIWTHQFYKSGK